MEDESMYFDVPAEELAEKLLFARREALEKLRERLFDRLPPERARELYRAAETGIIYETAGGGEEISLIVHAFVDDALITEQERATILPVDGSHADAPSVRLDLGTNEVWLPGDGP